MNREKDAVTRRTALNYGWAINMSVILSIAILILRYVALAFSISLFVWWFMT